MWFEKYGHLIHVSSHNTDMIGLNVQLDPVAHQKSSTCASDEFAPATICWNRKNKAGHEKYTENTVPS